MALAKSDSVTSFTTIVPGIFTNLTMRGLLNIWNRTDLEVMSIDGGDIAFTTSSTELIAAYVVAVLKTDEADTRNKRVRIR